MDVRYRYYFFFIYFRSDPKILEMLIDAGFELDSRMKSGESALHIAVTNEFKDCASLLIQNGCNINIQVYIGFI